jgi:hypothetical protein
MSFKFSPQGTIMVADRDASGFPLAFKPTGCADDLTVAFALDTFEHIETCSGQRAVDYRGTKSKKATIQTTLTDYRPDNLVIALNGALTAAAGSGSAVVAEAAPAALVDTAAWALGWSTGNPKTGITLLTVVDSAGTPATLVAGTDYLLDATTGIVTVLNLGAYVQPLKASYTHQAQAQITMLTTGQVEKWVRFNVIDTANANRKSVVDLYRVLFDPTTDFPLLAEELAALKLSGSVLVDDKKPLGGALGQFGRMTLASVTG